MELTLDPRKELIMAAAVEAYIEQALPVGSRTVVRRGIKLSSATVRSEMSELEAMGLLEKPHHSSGRLPSERGFRYYVERLSGRQSMRGGDKERLDSFCSREGVGAGELIARLAAELSSLTHHVGLVMMVAVERAALKSLHLAPHGPRKIRAVFELADGGREERLIANEWSLDERTLQKLTNLVNLIAPGRTLTGMRRELLRQMEETRAQANLLLARAAELSARLISSLEPELFIEGQSNLADVPEFAEIGALREVLKALEEKKLLVKVLEEISMVAGLRVIIGGENQIAPMQRCSIIASTYGRGGLTAGSLGVIGPIRMDYARLIPLINYASGRVSECLSRGA